MVVSDVGTRPLRTCLQDLCDLHPLVVGDVKQQLQEAALQREAAYLQRRNQSALAYAAFLRRQQQPQQRKSQASSTACSPAHASREASNTGCSDCGAASLDTPQDFELEDIAAAALDDLPGGSQEGSEGASGVVVAPSQACGWTEEEQAAFIRIR